MQDTDKSWSRFSIFVVTWIKLTMSGDFLSELTTYNKPNIFYCAVFTIRPIELAYLAAFLSLWAISSLADRMPNKSLHL